MWGVIRARQGVSPSLVSTTASFDNNSKHLAKFSCKGERPSQHPEVVTLAFERTNHGKMTGLMQSGTPWQRKQALAIVEKLAYSPVDLAQLVASGAINALLLVCADNGADPQIREVALRILGTCSRTHEGRTDMINSSSSNVLLNLLSDTEPTLRRRAAEVLSVVCKDRAAAEDAVQSGAIGVLVARLPLEEERTLPFLLRALRACLGDEGAVRAAISASAVSLCTELLTASASGVRFGAAHVISRLAELHDGKAACLAASGCLETLVDLLDDKRDNVRDAAATALANIAVTVSGKLAAVEAGAIAGLARIVARGRVMNEGARVPSPATQIKALTAMAVVAEHPRARRALQPVVKDLQALVHGAETSRSTAQEQKLIKVHAQTAVDVITWNP